MREEGGGQQFLHYTAPKSPYLRKSGLVSLDFPLQFCSAVNGARQLPRISLLIIAVTVIQTVGAFYASLWIYEDSRKVPVGRTNLSLQPSFPRDFPTYIYFVIYLLHSVRKIRLTFRSKTDVQIQKGDRKVIKKKKHFRKD